MSQEKQYYYFDGRPITIGDRVMCVIDHPDGNESLHVGDLGTVTVFTDIDYYRPIGVEWDHLIEKGHSLWARDQENAADGYGWWVLEKEIYTLAPDVQPEFEPAESGDILAMLGMK